MDISNSALLITRAFPPASNVGVHRIVGLCRHLVDNGWRVTVVTSAPPLDAPVDEAMMRAVPEAVRVVRTAAPDLPLLAARIFKGRKKRQTLPTSKDESPKATPSVSSEATVSTSWGSPVGHSLRRIVDWLSWWLHIPDEQAGWFLPAMWAGLRESRRTKPDVIFSTAPVWTAHVVAAAISKICGIPLVIDFRDPWCESTFVSIPYAAHRRFNRFLERMVVARAATITCAWDGIRRSLVGTYPVRANDIVTIHNGFDSDAIERVAPRRLEDTGRVFVHAGSFYGPRSPVPLLVALQQIQANGDLQCDQAKFVLAGPTEYNGRSLHELILEFGVADWIRIIPRLSHQDALGILKGADAVMLFGQSGSEMLASVPAKAYEYIGTGKPVLAIGAGDEVCELMRRGGCPIWDVPADSPERIALAISDMVRFLHQGGYDEHSASAARAQFARGHMATALEEVLLKACSSRCHRRQAEPASEQEVGARR